MQRELGNNAVDWKLSAKSLEQTFKTDFISITDCANFTPYPKHIASKLERLSFGGLLQIKFTYATQ